MCFGSLFPLLNQLISPAAHSPPSQWSCAFAQMLQVTPAACCLCRPPEASMGELLVRLHCPCHATTQHMQHPSSCHQCLPIPCSASLLQTHPAFGKRMAMLGKVHYIWVGCAVAVLHIEVAATCLRSPPAAPPCQQDPVWVLPTTMQVTEVFQQRPSFEIRREKKKKVLANPSLCIYCLCTCTPGWPSTCVHGGILNSHPQKRRTKWGSKPIPPGTIEIYIFFFYFFFFS